MRKFIQPRFADVFKKSSPGLFDIKPVLFDVSLRDGIQGASPAVFTTKHKVDTLHSIYRAYEPPKMEIGSFVSPKVLPIMADTPILLGYLNSAIQDKRINTVPYALVPNKRGLKHAMECGVRNFSLITSASNLFQLKNTKMDLIDTKTILREMMAMIRDTKQPCLTKLYISCISECPLAGKLRNDRIIYEILSYTADSYQNIDEFCLSDTMGTLKHSDFAYILKRLLETGMDPDKISLHLHIGDGNKFEAEKILYECFSNGVRRFDVSQIEQGGCSVTLSDKQLRPNMSYDFFYRVLSNYLDEDPRYYLGL